MPEIEFPSCRVSTENINTNYPTVQFFQQQIYMLITHYLSQSWNEIWNQMTGDHNGNSVFFTCFNICITHVGLDNVVKLYSHLLGVSSWLLVTTTIIRITTESSNNVSSLPSKFFTTSEPRFSTFAFWTIWPIRRLNFAIISANIDIVIFKSHLRLVDAQSSSSSENWAACRCMFMIM